MTRDGPAGADQTALRQLDDCELDLVCGGNITGAVATAGKLVSKAVTGLMDVLTGGNSFPIRIDFSGAQKAGQQLGQGLGGGRPA
jgi:hypothetical protein